MPPATIPQTLAVQETPVPTPAPADSLTSYLPRIDQFYIPEWLTMQFIANNLISFTPLFSYGSTIISIERSQTALGFSIDICATMLIASILRISYYLITPYEIALLRQSLVMVMIQLGLLWCSLKYRPEEYKYTFLKKVESFSELWENVTFLQNGNNFLRGLSQLVLILVYKVLKFFDPGYQRVFGFWQWDNDKTFWKFIGIFSVTQFMITFFISKVLNWDELAQWLGSIIGFIGLLVESLLPLPQIAILVTLKSVQGFKLIILISWLCGDTLKITYLLFGTKNVSVLFIMFGLFQMSLDVYIGGQYIYYKYYYGKENRLNESIELELFTDKEMDPGSIESENERDINIDTTSLSMENKEDTPPPLTGTSRRSSTV